MSWEYLDKMDKNLLYIYVKSLYKGSCVSLSRQLFDLNNQIYEDCPEKNELYIAEKWKETGYYLIWFVYRYVLKCKTFEEAEMYATEEILKKYRLIPFFLRRRLYIGVYGMNEIYLYKAKKDDMEDVKIVLEILYNRYDFFEQLECFIRRTSNTSGMSRSSTRRCREAMKECLDILTNSSTNRTLVKKYLKGKKKND